MDRMDSRLTSQQEGAAAEQRREELVRQRLETMKRFMPRTMECIEDRVQHVGPQVRALVRRALRGEPGCFYAFEAGHVMGNPAGLDRAALQGAAEFMVVYGCTHVCIWPAHVWHGAAEGVGDGAH